MTLHYVQKILSTPQKNNENPIRTKNKFNKAATDKLIYHFFVFHRLITKYQKEKLKKNFHLKLNKKYKISRNKFNQGSERTVM